MSRYLIDRIESLPNVDLRVRSEVVELLGNDDGILDQVAARDRRSGEVSLLPARHVFMFIGADPNTSWLGGCLALDEKGYVLTGPAAGAAVGGPALPLQTSLPRVFAIGDVRSGSTKRIASAVGEGAAVVAQIHSMLEPRVVAAA
jgi:thioredoxin reductase (NADPH)